MRMPAGLQTAQERRPVPVKNSLSSHIGARLFRLMRIIMQDDVTAAPGDTSTD
jgi:hypothetical protein